jgi:hypothetical protein
MQMIANIVAYVAIAAALIGLKVTGIGVMTEGKERVPHRSGSLATN